MSKRLNTYLMALTTVVLWGASFPLTKAALDHVGPTSLAFLRWAISAAVLIAWLGLERRDPSTSLRSAQDDVRALRSAQDDVGALRSAQDDVRALRSARHSGLALIGGLLQQEWRAVAWVALSGVTLFYWLENTAMKYTTATNAGVLSNLTAVFIVLIAIVTLGERLRALEWAALAAAFIGAVLVSQGAGHLAMSETGLVGDLLMVVAGLFAAFYSIGGKRLAEKYPAAAVTTAVATVGALFLLPLALIEGLRLDLPLSTWGIVLVLGVGAGALANVWWLAILARMEASRAALALFLIPIISATLAVILLDEPLTPMIIIGALLVLAGVMVVQRKAG